jgi:hypothetical protein
MTDRSNDAPKDYASGEPTLTGDGFNESKPFYQSKIINSVVLMLATTFVSKYGLDLSPEALANLLMGIITVGGSIIAAFRKWGTKTTIK